MFPIRHAKTAMRYDIYMSGSFLGHTRFSLFEPTSPSWRLSRHTGKLNEAAYKDRLYSAERMRSRVEIFFDHSLPLIDKASKDYKLVHVVSYSEEMPDIYRRYLESAAKKYKWVHLDRRQSTNRSGIPLETWAGRCFPRGEIFAEYRLDDDDLLATTYFDSLAKYLSDHFVGYYVSHGYGVQAFFEDGRFKNPRIEHRPKIAIGLARVCQLTQAGKVRGPKRSAHTQIDRWAPVVVDSKNVEFLHSIHLTQDSGIAKPEGDLGKRFRNYLSQPEVTDINILNEKFPGLPLESYITDRAKIRALVDSHANLQSAKGVLDILGRRIRKRLQ